MLCVFPKYIQTRDDNDTKVTDSSPSLITWEQVKSTTLTADTNEILRIDRIVAEIAANALTGPVPTDPQSSATIQVGYSIENSGDSAKTTPDTSFGSNQYNAGQGSVSDCNNNNFSIKRRGVNYVGEKETDIIVRFWMRYTLSGPSPPTVTSYCIRNTRVTSHSNQRVQNE